jgi:hypothetical protein
VVLLQLAAAPTALAPYCAPSQVASFDAVTRSLMDLPGAQRNNVMWSCLRSLEGVAVSRHEEHIIIIHRLLLSNACSPHLQYSYSPNTHHLPSPITLLHIQIDSALARYFLSSFIIKSFFTPARRMDDGALAPYIALK